MQKPLSGNILLINVCFQQMRIAYLENNIFCQFYIENKISPSSVGSIYKGQVTKKQSSLDAYFVNIGQNTSAFLHSYTHPETDVSLKNAAISLSQGQTEMFQVIKDPMKGKLSRVSTNISLPGNFLVYLPKSPFYIGVSRRISEEKDRERLINIVTQWNLNCGIIIRTNAVFASIDQLKKDWNQLQKEWAKIQEQYKSRKSFGRIWSDVTLTFQTLRNLLTKNLDYILVDDKETKDQIYTFVKETHPELIEKISLYTDTTPLFDFYNIEKTLSTCLEKNVWLPSGGFIVIEETETGIVIDVNTGRFTSKNNSEETILQTNLEAVKEIARQLRLRNCGGIIIIDFIDMKTEEFNQQVMECLEKELIKDRMPTRLLPMSDLGIVQLTRKRTRTSLLETLFEPCANCTGRSHVKNPSTITADIIQQIQKLTKTNKYTQFSITSHPTVIHWMKEQKLSSWARKRDIHLTFESNPDFHIEHFEIHT